jgi:hypothetical protein
MVRLRLNDDEFTHLNREKKDTGASISSIIRDALMQRRERLSPQRPTNCRQEQA